MRQNLEKNMDIGEEWRSVRDPAGGQPDFSEDSGEIGQEAGKKLGYSPNKILCVLLLNRQMTPEMENKKALTLRRTFSPSEELYRTFSQGMVKTMERRGG